MMPGTVGSTCMRAVIRPFNPPAQVLVYLYMLKEEDTHNCRRNCTWHSKDYTWEMVVAPPHFVVKTDSKIWCGSTSCYS